MIADDDGPAQVTGVGVTPGAQQLTVFWTAVTGADGYGVQWKSGRQDFDASRRQHVVTGGTTTSYTIPPPTAEISQRALVPWSSAARGPRGLCGRCLSPGRPASRARRVSVRADV